MKIDRLSSVPAARTRRGERTGSAKPGGFSKTLSGGEAPAAASVSGGVAPGRVDALLALQEVANELEADGQARRRGEELLDRLDEVRLALLSGRLPVAAVERLAALVAARRARVRDPHLAQVLDEIELRAAVELAKLGR
ncbi:MAG: flagellar assembly protein FliX [Kiloniellaceae bacterium]